MMNKTRFVDCFWGSDFNSTAGFDTLCKRMRDGKQMCVEFEEFIKQRADAEERYGKSLMKLARTGETMMEIGTLRQSWDAVRQETENCGRAHIEFSQQLLENVEKVTREFKEEQKNKRKPVEDNIKKVQRNKKLCFDNHLKAKKLYEQRCRDHDACVDQLKKSASQQSRDEEKLRQRLAKAKTSVESADTNYQSTVKHLEESRKEWEQEMESCCKTFQELEKERIAFLRNSMWTYTNLGSTNCVKNDEFFEETRKSLEHCDIDSDIHLFISAKQTGSERPGQIFYENFYTVQNNQKSGLSTPQSTRGGHPLGKQQSLPPTPVQRNQNDFIDDEEEEDPTYASVHDFKKATNKARSSRIVMAEYDYTAQGREELTFNEGDLIKVLHEEDGTWWRGEIKGRTGMFPRDFVKIVK